MIENEMPESICAAQSMPLLQWLGDKIPGGFFIYRADDTQELLYENSTTLRIFGCETPEEFAELTGGTFPGLVHPEDYEAVQASIDEQITERHIDKTDAVHYRIVRKDGGIRWIDDFGHYAQLPGYGDVYYVFITDVTEKHLIEEENRRRAEVIEGLSVNHGSIFLLDLDDGTAIPYRLSGEYFQKVVASLGGLENIPPDWGTAFAAYAERFVAEEDLPRYLSEIDRDRIRERLEEEPSYRVNYMCAKDDGTPIFAEMFVAGIGDGDFRHAVMAYEDVTERTKKVQQDMADRLRTEMELEREKHANEVKSSFLFNISHDIRTPMNAIMGFSNLAKRYMGEPERLADCLDKVDESGQQLMALIEDMLEMSRIDYGRIEIKAQPADLRAEIGKVLDQFREQAAEKGLELSEEIELPDREVLVDGHRFRRVMGNLVGNAVKYTPTGGSVTVSAKQKRVSDSGYARFEFCVSDTGIGMSEDFMRRMYEAFEREESSTKSGAVGTGLGLSIAKSLIDMMGGSISVKSAKGEGSAFTVDLPLKFADHVAGSGGGAEEEAAYRADGEHRILLVEDIEINRMLAETILEEAGFKVESVPDGCDAVEAVQSRPPFYYDLVLMDIQMPVMNGYEATRAIRALNRMDIADLPIIALSANAREEDKRMSMDSGMNHHVAKPFDIADLIATVNAHIAARNRKGAAGARE